jgi:hypothetical protein
MKARNGIACVDRVRGMGSSRARLLQVTFALLGVLGSALPAYATHFRYGNLTWQPVSGRTVNFNLTDAFRRGGPGALDPCVNPASAAPYTIIACTGPAGGHGVGDVIREDIGGTQLEFGDGTHTPVGATPLLYVVTAIDLANNWSFVSALDPAKLPTLSTDITHTYGGATASFTAKVDDCCRISPSTPPNGHINNPDLQFTLSTLVTFGGNSCPVSIQVPIVNCPINTNSCNFNVPASDANGDTLRWRLATSLEADSDPTPPFAQPGPPSAPNAATINATTGLYTWNTTGATLAGGGLNTLYSTQVIIEDLTGPGGTVKCRTPVDFLIQLVPQVNNPPVCNAPSPQNVTAGSPLSFVASGSDPDVGDTVTLNAVGLPAGATMTPALPVSGTTVSSTFNWTPGISDVGSTIVQYSVTDNKNQQTLCSVTINVQCNVALCGDGNTCTDDTCSVSGCVHTNNTAPCNDGNACTTNDVCGGGTCGGGGATNCDDNNVCTTDGCLAQTGCTHTPNNNSCSDGSFCTTGDACVGGSCVGGPAPDCNDNNVCTNDGCNPQTGCTATNNTAPCSDGNACTLDDTCSGGSCASGSTANCDDSNACTTDSCSVALGCQHVTLPNCQPCNTAADCSNNNACDGAEQCIAGQCQSGTAPNCNDGNLCTDDGCNPGTGCTYLNNNAPCNDGNACTTADACSAGACAGGPAPNCNDNNSCTNDSCDVGTGCVNANNTAPCNDDNACTTMDTCGGGTCQGGPALVCNDGNVCTSDSCSGATGCVFANNTLPCNDGDACTTTDVCGDGICNGGPPPTCADMNPCTDDDCDPGTGCTFTENHDPCDDGDPCTTQDECHETVCAPGGPTDCSDGNVCTTDSCDSGAGGCQHADNAAPCNDGNGCTLGDACAGGDCQPGGVPKDCDDQNGCTDDSCDAPFGTCVNAPNSDVCNDANACTDGDVCSGGSCQPGGPTVCDDANGCTDDSCNPSIGCVTVNNNTPCSDGSACTTNDACSGGTCVGGPAPNCNDNNVCTDDGCTPATGCFSNNNTLPCSDDNACTTGDTCGGGACQAGSATGCDDGNACTADSCVAPTGCQNPGIPGCCNTDAECADTDACTQDERCVNHGCVSNPVNCNDSNGCTDDGCNVQTGCTHVDNADPCSDSNACTTADGCVGGACVGGPPPDCNDNNGCTDDSCNVNDGCVNANNTDPCSDDSECTVGDVCGGGTCHGGPAPNCNDGNECTDDACDPLVPGGCVNSDNADECNDGNGCTVNDVCANRQCTGEARNCAEDPADNPCTLDSCSNQEGAFLCIHTNCLDLMPTQCPAEFPECGPGSCGNGRIDDLDETCEPPDQTPIPDVDPMQETCRNDCTFCGDGIIDAADQESCDDGLNNVKDCSEVNPTGKVTVCQTNCTAAICRDPAKITLGSVMDRFDLHLRLSSASDIDFTAGSFVVQLTDDADTVVFRASLDQGRIIGDPVRGKFKFKDKTAKIGGGVEKLTVSKHGVGYRMTIKMYGQFTDPKSPHMVTHVYVQDAEWTVVADWERTKKGWYFRGR